MKNMKVILQLFAIAFVVVIASSCRDEFTEKDAIDLQSQAAADAAQLDASLSLEQQREMELLRDSLARIGGIIQYTVSVVDAGNAVFADGDGTNSGRVKGTKAVSGATVTLAQNGVIATATTGADGLAVFDDMRIGNAAVNVAVADFTDVNYVADLTPRGAAGSASGDVNYANLTRTAATQIPVFPTTGPNTGTLTGRVTFESDLTNNTPEFPATNVIATINADDNFIAKYIHPIGDEGNTPNEDLGGRVIRISYSDASVSGAVDPTDGSYSLTVPASAAGLEMFVVTSDVIADQTLLLNEWRGQSVVGEQTVRALFGPGVRDAGSTGFPDNDYSNMTDPSSIPWVSPAYVTFSAPDATGGVQQPQVEAEGTAVVGWSGTISSIEVDDAGKGYTQAPVVVIDGDGVGAAATATISTSTNIMDQVVTGVTVDNAGTGYTDDDTSVSLEFGGDEAEIDVTLLASVQTVQGTGPVITDIGSDAGGPTLTGDDNFSAMPPVAFSNSGSGSGAGATGLAYGTLAAANVLTRGAGYVSKYKVGGTSSAYRISGPDLVISNPDFPVPSLTSYYDEAEGWVKVEGPVTAVALDAATANNDGDRFLMDDPTAPTLPAITLTPNQGAVVPVTVADMSTTDGVLAQIVVDEPGTGFTFPAPVSVSGNGVLSATMGVNSIAVTNGGKYTLAEINAGQAINVPGSATASATYSTGITSAWGNQPLTSLTTGWDPANLPVWTANLVGTETRAVITGQVTGTALTGLTITTAGGPYTFATTGDPVFAITSGTDGSGGAFVPTGGFSITAFTVVANGSGYTNTADNITVTPSAAASIGANLGQGTGTANDAAGTVTDLEIVAINIVDEGSGYNFTTNPTVTIGGNGSGAIALAFVATSIDPVFTVTTGGNYITGNVTFGISINQAAPVAQPARLATAGIVGNPLTYAGAGFSGPDTQVWVTGNVFSATISNGGNGFNASPTIAVDPTDGQTTAATFAPELNDDKAFVWINNGGADYLVNGGTFEVEVSYNGGTPVPLSDLDLDNVNTGLPLAGPISVGFQDGLLSLAIADGGSGYTANPWVKIVSGTETYWQDWTATATGGAVTALTQVNTTRLYTTAPTVTVATWMEAAGIDEQYSTSGIVAVEIDEAGEGYTTVPEVVFWFPTASDNTGSGATAVATIADGRVVDVTITNPGSGYVFGDEPKVRFRVPNAPYMAMGHVVVNDKGAVVDVYLIDSDPTGQTLSGNGSGFGYLDPALVTVTITASATDASGNPIGSGATAIAEISRDTKIKDVEITNGGSGYFGQNYPGPRLEDANQYNIWSSSNLVDGQGFSVWPDGPWFISYPAKTRVKEISLGTGIRDDDMDDSRYDD
jgi:hypothetical protein